ncbi:MAG TPA: penicillin acylase family protein [Candidatus Limnocylindrales bacterium]|nr:penicillin acylase family protein [Candidatus Limnocylindrales bacterium]
MRFVRWGLRAVAIVALVLVVAIVGLLALVTARGLAQTSGSIRIEGLHAPVTVVRDDAGIIQIRADDPHDLFLAQGYVHAQDRMWQMEVWRHISAGRLSELFGEGRVDTDRFIRTLGWREAAQRDVDAMPEDVRAALLAYADGVNAWLADHEGAFGPPFVIAGLLAGTGGLGGYTPEPWTPLDSAAWQKVQAWNLGGNMDQEIFRLLADAHLGTPERTDELFPAYDPGAPVITPTGLEGSGGAGAGSTALVRGDDHAAATPDSTPAEAASVTVTAETAAAWRDVAGLGAEVLALAGLDNAAGLAGSHGIGSNNWVIAGSRTATGGALLANDPHLGFNMPSVWIMNGLHCRIVSEACPFDVTGVSFPGVPAVVLGHNARIAWGATNVGPDVQDLFRETVDPDDPTRYLFEGESRPFETRTETIRVAGGDDVVVEIRSTHHGPILNDVDDRLEAEAPIALQWTSIREPDGAFTSIFRLNTAADFEAFRAALTGYGSPSQNFVYADVDGHVGYQLPGLIPLRDGDPAGDRIRDGASGEAEWTGYVPFDDLPWQYDPPSGVIVTANNAAVDATYPFFISNDWDPGYRAQRVLDRLAAIPDGAATAADLRAIQMDAYLLRADEIVPGLLAGATPATADGRLLLDRIRSWDRACDVDSTGCAAYVATELTLTRAIFEDELGPLAGDWIGSTFSWQALIAALADPASAWWDDSSTPTPERDREVIAAAIDRTAAELRDSLGQPGRWTWGRIHAVDFREQSLGLSGIGPLEWYFNSGARPVGGADGAVQNNYYQTWRAFPDADDPGYVPWGLDRVFGVSNGPSYRLTIDMSAQDAARIVITTGNSGNPFDRHANDLIDDWAAGGTVPLPFSWDAIEASAASTLRLEP